MLSVTENVNVDVNVHVNVDVNARKDLLMDTPLTPASSMPSLPKGKRIQTRRGA